MDRLRALTDSPTWTFLLGLYRRYQETRLPFLAAALAYYAAFSLGPLLLLLAGWLGVVLQRQPEISVQYREALIDLVAQLVPLQENSAELVTNSFEVILFQLSEGALLRSLVSLVVLLWVSSNFFTSLQLALDVIFDVPETRGFWRKRLISVLLVVTVALVIAIEIIGGVLVSALVELSDLLVNALASFNILLPALPFGLGTGLWIEALRTLLATFAFLLCFRYMPRRSSSWVGALVGALVSTGGIMVMREVLRLTFNFERYNLIYGVITSLVVILLWLYLALLLFMVGALVAAEISTIQRRRRRVRAAPGQPPGAGRIESS